MPKTLELCTADFHRLAAEVGGLPCDESPVVRFSNPLDATHWSLPMIEIALVIGAVAAFVHAYRWYRRTGEAVGLVICFSGIIALLILEPFAYFPQWFGLEDIFGLAFAHNQFTIQFFFDRIPLYIVAMYPAYCYAAFALVRRAGIVDRFSPFVSAACTALVFHCTYMIADLVGPQWQWWIWNTEAPTGAPAIGTDPLQNIQSFAVIMPFALTLGALWTAKRSARGGGGIALSVLVCSVLLYPIMVPVSSMGRIVEAFGGSGDDGRLFATIIVIAVMMVVAVPAFVRARLSRAADSPDSPASRDRFAFWAVSVYLLTMAVIWGAAIPGYFDAVDGIAPGHGPITNIWYAAAAAAGSLFLLWSAHAPSARSASSARLQDARV